MWRAGCELLLLAILLTLLLRLLLLFLGLLSFIVVLLAIFPGLGLLTRQLYSYRLVPQSGELFHRLFPPPRPLANAIEVENVLVDFVAVDEIVL